MSSAGPQKWPWFTCSGWNRGRLRCRGRLQGHGRLASWIRLGRRARLRSGVWLRSHRRVWRGVLVRRHCRLRGGRGLWRYRCLNRKLIGDGRGDGLGNHGLNLIARNLSTTASTYAQHSPKNAGEPILGKYRLRRGGALDLRSTLTGQNDAHPSGCEVLDVVSSESADRLQPARSQ